MKSNHWWRRALRRGHRSEIGVVQRRSNQVVLRVEPLEDRLVLDDASTHAVTGIHSRNLLAPGGLILSGAGVSIGQVETGRPGKPGFDNANNSHPDVIPTAVFFRSGAAFPNDTTDAGDGHGTKVAGVMIANGAGNNGVATSANLYASAVAAEGAPQGQHYSLFARSIQHVALQDSGKVRAINLSFGMPGTLNGESLGTQSVDWSARELDVLYAKSRGNAPPNGSGTLIPADSFNAVKVAATEKDGNGVFRKVWSDNDFTNATDGRRLTDFLAPGKAILVPPIDANPYVANSGASLATAHVTGTVALLQEYASHVGLGDNAQSHLVMKAVLMNSVDKIKDAGDGLRLGMEKDILKKDNTTWLESDARDEAGNQGGKILPLDNELGTGQLNAKRAVDQFGAGEQEPPDPGLPGVSAIGWDYNTINAQGDIKKYPFAFKLKANSYVSLTLAWDRYVGLNDGNANGQYDDGETFTSSPLVDLNLHLLPKGATDISQSRWSSDSTLYNLEHIFFKVETEDYYEFWVRRNNGGDPNKPYAVAWWTAPVGLPQERPGRKFSRYSSSTSAIQFQGAADTTLLPTRLTVFSSPMESGKVRSADDLIAHRKSYLLDQMVVERQADWPISLDQEIRGFNSNGSELLESAFGEPIDADETPLSKSRMVE